MKHAQDVGTLVVDDGSEQSDRDRGYGLVEIVATIAIMSVLLAPLMGAVIQSIRSSRLSSSMAQVETVLENAADRVNRAPVQCDYLVYVQAAAQSVGWSKDQANASYERWDGGAPGGPWVQGCGGQSPPPQSVQLVTITVTSPDQTVTKTLQVVKSDV